MHIIGQQLAQLANESEIVKNYLDIPKDWKNITKVTHNSVHRFLGFKDGKAMFQAKFVGNRKYKGFLTTNQYIRLIEGGAFEHCYKSLEQKYGQKVWDDYYAFQAVKGLNKKDFAKFAFNSTGALYSAAGASSPVDGRVGLDYQTFAPYTDQSFSTIRAATTGQADRTSATEQSGDVGYIRSGAGANLYRSIVRGINLFNTSSIGAGNIVTAAVLTLNVAVVNDNFSSSTDITSSNPASTSAIATTDLDPGDFGTTVFATRLNSGLAAGAGKEWTFTDFSGISLDGITKLGIRNSHDTANSAPTWAASKEDGISIYFADHATNDPFLTVTYTLPATGSGAMLLMGIGA